MNPRLRARAWRAVRSGRWLLDRHLNRSCNVPAPTVGDEVDRSSIMDRRCHFLDSACYSRTFRNLD